ncbi:Potassium transporter [Dispira parvispora]|uniref:Potassium transporter n=1 Tax=Dispira parvispora TaxID=1520584 RepID=A0A9W8APC2_9FUNG|nr:Potassium transporter [Dispira parvispora]
MAIGHTKWKREVINDHKFEYIDVNDFTRKGIRIGLGYAWIFILVIKATLVYVADLYTAVSLFFVDKLYASQQSIYNDNGLKDYFKYLRWVFLASIVCSYGLLFWEMRKARRILASRDIAYAYTSPLVYRYLCVISYPHYCFFCEIDRHRRTKDDLAFFVFFTLKSWKRVLFAESPRQVVSGIALVTKAITAAQKKNTKWFSLSTYGKDTATQMSFLVMLFTFAIYFISLMIMLVAFIIYIPLIINIQGNLKEYCCHKVDKRIAEILRKYSKRRIAKERMNQSTCFSETKCSSDAGDSSVRGKPTLPKIEQLGEENRSTTPLPQYTNSAANYSNPYGAPQAFGHHLDSSFTGGYPAPPQEKYPPTAGSVAGEALEPSAMHNMDRSMSPSGYSEYDQEGGPMPQRPMMAQRRQLADVAYAGGRQPTLPSIGILASNVPYRGYQNDFENDVMSNNGYSNFRYRPHLADPYSGSTQFKPGHGDDDYSTISRTVSPPHHVEERGSPVSMADDSFSRQNRAVYHSGYNRAGMATAPTNDFESVSASMAAAAALTDAPEQRRNPTSVGPSHSKVTPGPNESPRSDGDDILDAYATMQPYSAFDMPLSYHTSSSNAQTSSSTTRQQPFHTTDSSHPTRW